MRKKQIKAETSCIVVDGYQRAIDGLEAEARAEIEKKYADQWNAAGLVQRWSLRRRMEREITQCVCDRGAHFSPDSLY